MDYELIHDFSSWSKWSVIEFKEFISFKIQLSIFFFLLHLIKAWIHDFWIMNLKRLLIKFAVLSLRLWEKLLQSWKECHQISNFLIGEFLFFFWIWWTTNSWFWISNYWKKLVQMVLIHVLVYAENTHLKMFISNKSIWGYLSGFEFEPLYISKYIMSIFYSNDFYKTGR